MKKVLKLVKSRKSSSASSSQRGQNRSPGKGSIGRSSLGGESASATSMIYESQRNKGLDGVSSQNRDSIASPSKSFTDRASVSHIPLSQVSKTPWIVASLQRLKLYGLSPICLFLVLTYLL
jgi:hypothetical protein